MWSCLQKKLNRIGPNHSRTPRTTIINKTFLVDLCHLLSVMSTLLSTHENKGFRILLTIAKHDVGLPYNIYSMYPQTTIAMHKMLNKTLQQNMSLLSLLPVAIDCHLLETISLTVTGKLLASGHSSVESLQLREIVETTRSKDEMVIKQVKHRVVHEWYLKLQHAQCLRIWK